MLGRKTQRLFEPILLPVNLPQLPIGDTEVNQGLDRGRRQYPDPFQCLDTGFLLLQMQPAHAQAIVGPGVFRVLLAGKPVIIAGRHCNGHRRHRQQRVEPPGDGQQVSILHEVAVGDKMLERFDGKRKEMGIQVTGKKPGNER